MVRAKKVRVRKTGKMLSVKPLPPPFRPKDRTKRPLGKNQYV
jgi:hypothetical protein